jgi:putative membrane-bound dehydrogenase-like protein
MKNPMTKATSQTQHAVSWRGAGSGVFLPAVSLLTIFVMATLSRSASAAGFDVAGTDPDAVPVVPAGFVATMPAREPLVRNVSMLVFDTRGRLFAAMGPQYRHPRDNTPGDAIVRLVDADGDGTFDATKPFAGPFHCVQGMAWKQGPRGPELWVANAPDLTVARDTDGDGEADEYVRIATGLGTLEHALDAITFAPDGFAYFGKGDTPVFGNAPRAFRDLAQVEAGTGAVDDPEPVMFPRAEWPAAWRASYRFPTDGHSGGGILRCNASGKHLAIVCRGCRNPWGMAFDDSFDWLATDQDDVGGDRFLMPFMGAHFGMRHRWNNSWTGEGTLASVPASGPLAEGSGTGVLFYDSREFPETHRHVFYRADWLRGTVEIFRREWHGAMLMPAGGRVESFASLGDTKPLFRPTGMAVGPDGAIWTGGWGSTYGWNGDKTEGRVFRIAAEGGPSLAAAVAKLAARPALETRSVADVAVDCDSPIVAMRVAAQDELLQRASGSDSQAAAARREIAVLAAAAIKEPGREARQTWLLWTLGRIAADDAAGDAFFAGLVESNAAAISESNRIQAVRILAHRVAGRSADARTLPPCVIARLTDRSPRVRFAAMLAAASVADRAAVPAIIDAAASETDRLVHYAAWATLRDLMLIDELRGLLADGRAGVRLAAVLALLDLGRLDGPAVVSLSKDADERVSQTATTWLANTGFGLDDPAAVLATIKRLDNRHVDYRLRLALLQKLEGKAIDGGVRADLEKMYIDQYRSAGMNDEEVVPQEKSQEIAAVLWAVKPDRRVAETAWELLGHGWPMLADSVAAGYSKLGAEGLAVLAEKIPMADAARRDRGVEALAGYAAAGRGLAASEPLVAGLAAAWDKNPQPAFRGKVLACLAAIDPAFWQAAPAARSRAEKLLLAAAADPDPRLLDRVPSVASILGVPTPKLAEPRPPTKADAVLGRLKDADPARGARLFADARGANCAACHRAGDHGVGGIGPELSDIGLRAAPAAIAESILQPSATIIEGYRVSALVLDDGRSLTGLVLDDTPDTVRVIDGEGRSTSVRKDAIEERAVQQVSLMPAGYDRTLTPEELADLVAFLLTQKRPAGQVAAVP